MASKPVAQLSSAEKEQLAVSYAAFILSAQGSDVNAETIAAVLKAANINASQSLINAFAKTLNGKKVTDFIGSVGSGSAPASAPAQDTKKPDAKETKGKTAPPPPPPPAAEEEEMDMGGLFDWFQSI